MDIKTGLLVCALLVGCFALPKPADDLSKYFNPRDTRIVGGTEAAEGSHPHMVALHSGLLVSSFLCGGAIVTHRSILTAAHCINAVTSSGALVLSTRVTVGTNRWNIGGQTYRLTLGINHPDYDEPELRDDIGLLITETDIQYSKLVQPISLSFDFVPEGVRARVAGWGLIYAGGPLSSILLEVDMSIVDGESCVKLAAEAALNFPQWYFPPIEPAIHICPLHSVGHGCCHGDSGSPLVHSETGKHIGLVSWGFPCAIGVPDVFVRTSAYQDFLTANLI